jgi:hypothetical protein
MSDESAQPAAKPSQREVIDPVAHLPILIHDITTEELEEVKPLNLSNKDVDPIEFRNAMMDVVKQEIRSERWADENKEKLRLLNALRAAAASTAGTVAGLLLIWAQSQSALTIRSILSASAVCCCGGLIAAGSTLWLTRQPIPAAPRESRREVKVHLFLT